MHSTRNLQFNFIGNKTSSDFGGMLLKNSHAKGRRPGSSRKAMHIVMRSSIAKGEFSFLHLNHSQKVKEIVTTQARKANVRLYRYANSGNHLHLLILPTSSKALSRFLRSIAGLIARFVMKSERGNPLPKGIHFWDQKPFSRIVSWGREYSTVARYLLQNTLEALGFIPYKVRKTIPVRLVASS